jgi:hypothetical protein
MGAPVGVGPWHAACPATPDRRRDRGDPRGGVRPRPQWPGALGQEPGGGNSGASRQAARPLGQERALGRTPQALGADGGGALGPDMVESAADARRGGPGHGPPALGLGLLRADAAVVVLDRAQTAMAQCEAGDRPAPGVQDVFGTRHRRLARAHPSRGPDRCGPRPRGEDAEPAAEPPDLMGVGGARDARGGGRAEPAVRQRCLGAADQRPQGWGPGEDDRPSGYGSEVVPPCGQPHRGIGTVALGATPGATGGRGLGLLTAGSPRHQLAAPGRGAAGDQSGHGTAMAGPALRAHPRLRGGPISSEDGRDRRPSRAPAR